MSQPERKRRILAALSREGQIDVESLAAQFAVAPQTVRRDLTSLVDAGLVTRTYGGARLAAAGATGHDARRMQNISAKAAIAREAARLVPHGASVALNIGTTTEQVARALVHHKELTVISNNLNIVQILRNAPLRSLIVIGGEVRPEDGALVGSDAVAALANYKVDVAIIGTSALDEDGSVLDHDAREVAVARAILANARRKVLVSDVSKFESRASNRICALAHLDHVVLDQEPPKPFRDAARETGTDLIIAREYVDV